MRGLMPHYYRASEVAEMLRCSEWWVKEQARNRRIPYSWIGGSYLFTAEHVAQIVRLFEVQPTTAEPVPQRTVKRPEPASEESAGRLRARPPRRVRNAAQHQTAA